MDLIAIDIGNSTISLGVFTREKLDRTEHVSVIKADSDSIRDMLTAFRELCGPQPLGAETVPIAVSSVNPMGLAIVEKSALEALNQNILLIGRDFPLEMKVAIENPKTVGPDRLLTAYAAYAVIESSVVIADFGTAMTIDCVNDNGIFLGGTILPGLNLSAQSLNEHTSALPHVKIKLPDSVFGINTESAIQSGIYYGALGALREIVERFAMELGHWPQVVATGGNCKLIAQQCDFIDSLVPDLCLDGLYLAYRRYRENLQAEQLP
ncbi:MAG: type III pantothenate kinase [Sedimentisphaerales bacterium]|nr:type III pantothenate kinase [Sedimentisphaerales bacterium]